MNKDVIESMKRYFNLHPLLFQRSLENAKDETELFETLSAIKGNNPLCWNEEKRSWEDCDLLQLKSKDKLYDV